MESSDKEELVEAAAFPGQSWVSAPIWSSWVGQVFYLFHDFMSSVKYGCLYLRKSYSAMKEMKTKEVVRKAGHESGLEPVAP